MTVDYGIQTEEFYTANSRADAASFGEEQKICDCGGVLDTVNIFFEDGVSFKICTLCGKEYYIDVMF